MRSSQVHRVGYVLAALGICGIIFSFSGEQSDYVDPVTFTIATVSIFVAIVGLALAFKLPDKDDQANQHANSRNRENPGRRAVHTDTAEEGVLTN